MPIWIKDWGIYSFISTIPLAKLKPFSFNVISNVPAIFLKNVHRVIGFPQKYNVTFEEFFSFYSF